MARTRAEARYGKPQPYSIQYWKQLLEQYKQQGNNDILGRMCQHVKHETSLLNLFAMLKEENDSEMITTMITILQHAVPEHIVRLFCETEKMTMISNAYVAQVLAGMGTMWDSSLAKTAALPIRSTVLASETSEQIRNNLMEAYKNVLASICDSDECSAMFVFLDKVMKIHPSLLDYVMKIFKEFINKVSNAPYASCCINYLVQWSTMLLHQGIGINMLAEAIKSVVEKAHFSKWILENITSIINIVELFTMHSSQYAAHFTSCWPTLASFSECSERLPTIVPTIYGYAITTKHQVPDKLSFQELLVRLSLCDISLQIIQNLYAESISNIHSVYELETICILISEFRFTKISQPQQTALIIITKYFDLGFAPFDQCYVDKLIIKLVSRIGLPLDEKEVIAKYLSLTTGILKMESYEDVRQAI